MNTADAKPCYSAAHGDTMHHLTLDAATTLCGLTVSRVEQFGWAAGCGPQLHGECLALSLEMQAAEVRATWVDPAHSTGQPARTR